MKKGGPIIELKNVWKIYEMGDSKVEALRGLDLEIKRGEFVTIMGPSGSGKSTCVNMVGCLDLPSKGKVILDGQDISNLGESELAQIRGRKIGFIFQTFNLINTLNAMENVALPMVFQNLSESDRLKRAKHLLNMVELDHRLYHKPNQMSGGERQRVAIARSLANDPEVILADEPTGNLDSKTGRIVLEFLQKMHRNENKTIIMVTHDPGMAKYSERVVHLRDGQILQKKR
ncbi:ABC transporter ATP-binding protein [Candidatus Woesearchaeota archaeon]|nr:ABC transporter ATP-binding protein [Candidatus Woesearchaeota archaeon]